MSRKIYDMNGGIRSGITVQPETYDYYEMELNDFLGCPNKNALQKANSYKGIYYGDLKTYWIFVENFYFTTTDDLLANHFIQINEEQDNYFRKIKKLKTTQTMKNFLIERRIVKYVKNLKDTTLVATDASQTYKLTFKKNKKDPTDLLELEVVNSQAHRCIGNTLEIENRVFCFLNKVKFCSSF